MAVQITMTTQLRHGVLIVSFQEKFSIVNSTGKPLVAFTALAAQGKKVSKAFEETFMISLRNTLFPFFYWFHIGLTRSAVHTKSRDFTWKWQYQNSSKLLVYTIIIISGPGQRGYRYFK